MSKAKKLKKPIDLPLGKASSQKDVDLSHVRLPIDTSILGLKHVLTLFETATNEVKSYLAYECDLMYECRICRTIFRSIANFILHKRKYCRDKYNSPKDPGQQFQEVDGVTIIQKDIESANKIIAETEDPGAKKAPGSCLNPIIENLLKRHKQKKLVEDIKKENSSDQSNEVKKIGNLRSISLEKIDNSDVAMFQTMEFGPNLGNSELMKSEVMEIHTVFDQNEVVLDSSGKIVSFDIKEKNNKSKPTKNDYLCTECNMRFLTNKTFTYHVKYKHGQNRLVYPCPVCKDQLSNAWSVYRHLLKVHRMTSNQIRKYRTQIHNSAICKKPEENRERRRSTKESREGCGDENEWLDNVEGDSDLQMCGGCGKHFDRKAALISHSVMCTKRIAVCNLIKENNSKKKESDVKENTEKTRLALDRPQEIGSAKRKSNNVIKYKPKSVSQDCENANKEEKKEDESEIMEINDDIPPILEEHDSDVENINNDWMGKEMQSLDKDKLLSIIGVDTGSSNDKNTTSSEDNVCSQQLDVSCQLSDRCDSPCRGFEFQSVSTTKNDLTSPENAAKDTDKLSEDVVMQAESNSPISVSSTVDNCKEDFGSLSDSKTESENSVCSEGKIPSEVLSVYPPKMSAANEMDSFSDISLDNKINCDFKLDLGEDPNFADVSIKPLIKEIIDEEAVAPPSTVSKRQKEIEQNTIHHKLNGVSENKTENVTNAINDEFDNNNTSICVSSSSNSKKRKRSNSSNQEKTTDVPTLKMSDERMNETELSAFMSKISPFVDSQNLTCSVCDSKFDFLSQLMLHMSNHFSWYRFQCSKCLFMSFNRNDCEKHVRRDHKLPSSHIPGAVLPIPTWKASLISDNFMHLGSKGDEKTNSKIQDSVDASVHDEKLDNYQSKVSSLVEVELDDTKNENINDSGDSANEDQKNMVLEYIDLTMDESPEDDTDYIEATDNLEGAEAIQDLSKQAIIEVILGNDPKKECSSSQSNEYMRPSRNRTKSIKASQKDFIYDFDTPKHPSLKGYCSKDNAEQIKQFAV